ncbi:hypothetical protein JX265_004688 [Neoarthrinium moseri]|uniref:TauD/TfdA-like domain-containing protein n=1 Tax=Neoarthrinium moseri TaxID=1658444 RepID=A0A9Q0AR39_9PEZI|nr:hypothetical protein JX265_004688 [Neoarthrinium moseri]
METSMCGLGCLSPVFHDAGDFDSICNSFYRNGVAFCKGCDESSLLNIAKNMGSPVAPRNASGRGVISRIRCEPALNGKTYSSKGYSSEELFFHTDRSGWELPPRILMTALSIKALKGGESLLVDGHRFLSHLRSEEPDLYDLVVSPQHSSFRQENGSFQGRPIFDEAKGILRFRLDNSVQLSGVLAEKWDKLKAAIYKHAYYVDFQPGDGYIVDNHRYLHGRTSFTGSRKFILFDVDGTICCAEDLSVHAFYRCISDVTGKEIRLDSTHVNLHGQTDMALVREVFRYHGIDASRIGGLMKTMTDVWPKYLQQSLDAGLACSQCSQIASALDWLMEQKQDGRYRINIGLLTGNAQANTELKIQSCGLSTKMFDQGISSFGDTCPSRLMLYQNAVGKMEGRHSTPIPPKQILLIGDTPIDINCAKKVGCKILAVATGNYDIDELRKHCPDFVCDNLADAFDFLERFMQN